MQPNRNRSHIQSVQENDELDGNRRAEPRESHAVHSTRAKFLKSDPVEIGYVQANEPSLGYFS